jgi:hypothetical protein
MLYLSEIVSNRLNFCSVIPWLLNPKRLGIQPVLIHGNLWANHWVRPLKLPT